MSPSISRTPFTRHLISIGGARWCTWCEQLADLCPCPKTLDEHVQAEQVVHERHLRSLQRHKSRLVLVIGSRTWTNESLIAHALDVHTEPGDTLLHGGAAGADRLANIAWGRICSKRGLDPTDYTRVFEAEWRQFKKKAGPIRNKRMVDMKPYQVLAFMCGNNSPGTKDCIRQAEKAKLNVILFKDETPAPASLPARTLQHSEGN